MVNRTKAALFFMPLFFILSCSPNIKVVKQANFKTSKHKGIPLAYFIPKNELLVRLEITNTSFQEGPFANFAEDLIGLKSEQKSHEHYSISNITSQTKAVVDSSRIYLLIVDKNNISTHNIDQILKSSALGKENEEFRLPQSDQTKAFVFKELSLSKMIIEDSKTSYRTVVQDSVTKRIPVVNKIIRKKTSEEMAKSAAKTLLKIRKRKFRIISAMNTHSPDGEALKQMLEALDEKEKYYESLFLGHSSQQTIYKTIRLKINKLGSQLLCYFDSKKGVVNQKTSGEPLWLNVQKTYSCTPQQSPSDKSLSQSFPYLLPEKCTITVRKNKQEMYHSRHILPQFNKLQYLPSSILKTRKLSIDHTNGTLKAID